ncbi:STN domain-containing protein, partial [Salmonella enterica]
STLTAGKRSNGLHGDFSTEAGLAKLLAGTGLSFQRQADGSFELHPATSAVVLPSQKVTGDDLEKKAVYTEPRSLVYISNEEVRRFGVISAGD